jgi:uncharacterized protein YvpB
VSRFLLRFSAASLLIFSATLPVTVNAQQVRLPATFHRQEHALSCEVATLKMALGVLNINVPESELIANLPFDTTAKRRGVWGDPNQGFVGNINGRMLIDGYGVYWNPLAALGNKYATTSIMQHGSPSQLAHTLAAGNPVIIWGYYGPRAVHGWRTPTGQSIHAVSGQHTRLVYGFDGPAAAPTHFYLLDPLSGPLTWSTAELMHNWSSLQHMGVVVAAHPQWVRVPGDSKVWKINAKNNTRRWVTTWQTFTALGGSKTMITDLDQAALQQYAAQEPII